MQNPVFRFIMFFLISFLLAVIVIFVGFQNAPEMTLAQVDSPTPFPSLTELPIAPENADQLNLLATLGHGVVTDLDWADNGQLIAVADLTNVWLYSAKNSEMAPACLRGHTDLITGVAFDPASALLAAASVDGTVRVWSVETHEELYVFQTQTKNTGRVAWSPDGTLLAAVDGESVRIWKVKAGIEDFIFEGNTLNTDIAFSPNGALLAVAEGSFVRLWDVDSHEEVGILDHGSEQVQSLEFSPNGRTLASGSGNLIDGNNGTLRIWNVQKQLESFSINVHTPILGVAFNSDGSRLASGNADGTVGIWSVENGKRITDVKKNEPVWSVVFSPNEDNLLAFSDAIGDVEIWDTVSESQITVLQKGFNTSSAAISLDGDLLALGNAEGQIQVKNVETGDLLAVLEGHASGVPGLDTITNLAFSPNGSILASGTQNVANAPARLWNWANSSQLATLENYSFSPICLAFSSDGTLLATCEGDAIRLWDAHTGTRIAFWIGNNDGVRTVAFSPNNTMLAASGQNGIITIWEVQTQTVTATLQGDTGWIETLAFNPDGTLLAAGGQNGIITIWEVQTQTVTATLQGDTGWIETLAFNPDGTLLAAGDDEGTIHLWEVESGDEIAVLQVNSLLPVVWIIEFSPDGTMLKSVSSDGAVQLWTVQ